jgi:hypothetical protein
MRSILVMMPPTLSPPDHDHLGVVEDGLSRTTLVAGVTVA